MKRGWGGAALIVAIFASGFFTASMWSKDHARYSDLDGKPLDVSQVPPDTLRERTVAVHAEAPRRLPASLADDPESLVARLSEKVRAERRETVRRALSAFGNDPDRLLARLRELDGIVAEHRKRMLDIKPVRRPVGKRGAVRVDYALGDRLVTVSTWQPWRSKMNILQFDLDADGKFDTAQVADRVSGTVVGYVFYDLNSDGKADFARADVNQDRQLGDREVFVYDDAQHRWLGVVKGAPESFSMSRALPPPVFPFPFSYW